VKRALVTGIAGQDGHFISQLLLARGYEVVGVSRNATRLADDRLILRDIDIADRGAVEKLFADFDFGEVYQLAGESFGPASWADPVATCDAMGTAVVQMLELIRTSGRAIRFFQASSSELFGIAREFPQRETMPMHPVTPYGIAKQLAHDAVGVYRDRHGLFACCGILFNHESPFRRPEFVTRKVSLAAARIRLGMQSRLTLGSLDARRDWGFAGDFAEAMWLMLQAPEAADYVVATGSTHSVRELCDTAFTHVGLDYRDYIDEDATLVRTQDFDRRGDPSKLMQLGWQPRVGFEELVRMMVDADMQRLQKNEGE